MSESVWEYPRPPALEPSTRRVRIEHGGVVVADSRRAVRVLETSHPPVYYLPPADVADGALRGVAGASTFCEFKGVATYFDVIGGDGRVAARAAWTYRDPVPAFAALRDHVAVYPGRVDACYLDDERVAAQAGDFYGG